MPSLADLFSKEQDWMTGTSKFQSWPESVMAPPEPWGHWAQSLLHGRYDPVRTAMGWLDPPLRRGATQALGPTIGNPVATGLEYALPSIFGGEGGIEVPPELPEAGVISKTGVLKLGEAELPFQHKTDPWSKTWQDSTLHPILDASGNKVGRLFLDLDEPKGHIHVRMISADSLPRDPQTGVRPSGFDRTPLLSIARQVREKYPWVKKVTGTRITGQHTGVNVYDPSKFGSQPKIGSGGVFEDEPDVAPTPEPEWRQQERTRQTELQRGGRMSPEERDRFIRARQQEPQPRAEPTAAPTPQATPFSTPRVEPTPQATPAPRSFDETMREFDERMRQQHERSKQTLRETIGSAREHYDRLTAREQQMGRSPLEEPIPHPPDLNNMTFDELLEHARQLNERNRLLLNRW